MVFQNFLSFDDVLFLQYKYSRIHDIKAKTSRNVAANFKN